LKFLAKEVVMKKSKGFKKAIKIMRKKEGIIYERMLDYKKNGNDSFLDIDELIKKKEDLEKRKNISKIIDC
jgi:hypothetical protein